MARPKIEGTDYKVSIHRIGRYSYAATQPRLTDVEGKTYNKHIHWGTVDENKEFHPNRLYLTTDPKERAKLVFPEDWDLSEAERLTKADNPSTTSQDKVQMSLEPELQSQTWLYGDIWLLEQITKKTSLEKDLLKFFKGDHKAVDDILTIVFYIICTGNPLSRLKYWQAIERTPSKRPLNIEEINRVMSSISEDHLGQLIDLRPSQRQEVLTQYELKTNLTNSMSSYWSKELTGHPADIWSTALDGTEGIEPAKKLIRFVGETLISNLVNTWNTTPLKDIYSSPVAILDSLRPLRYSEYEGLNPMGTPPNPEQEEICRIFGFGAPKI